MDPLTLYKTGLFSPLPTKRKVEFHVDMPQEMSG